MAFFDKLARWLGLSEAAPLDVPATHVGGAPGVAVAQAPATEICGSEAMLCSA